MDKSAVNVSAEKSLFWRNFPWSLWWSLSDDMRLRLSSLWNPYIVIGGYIWPITYIVGAALFTPFTSNPLMWITFQNTCIPIYGSLAIGCNLAYDHFWTLLIIAGLSLTLAVYIHQKTGIRYLTLGVISTWGSWLMWTLHEGAWWITNLFFDPKGWMLLFGLGSLLTLTTLWVLARVFRYFPWRAGLWIVAFYVVWAYFGFHVTVNYEGPTAFYADPGTFAWEIASWLWAAIGFWILERKNLLEWYGRVRVSLNMRQSLNSSMEESSRDQYGKTRVSRSVHLSGTHPLGNRGPARPHNPVHQLDHRDQLDGSVPGCGLRRHHGDNRSGSRLHPQGHIGGSLFP